MKPIFRKTILIALVLSVAACSSTPVRRSMKETWNDSLTASKIRYKMMRDSEVKKSRMHVEVYRGQVTLTGRSMTDVEKVRAETLAKSVKRVTGVENYVHVVGGSDTAVAKSPVKGVPSSAIQEKSIVAAKSTVAEDDAPATLATIRESTGKPAAATVVASRKAVDSKAATAVAKNGKLAKGKSAKPETKLATVRKASAPITTATAKAPVAAPVSAPAVVPSAIKEVAPVATQSTIPAAKVVGQSKTGLPWDGEVYADDATRVASPAKPVLATRAPAVAPTSAPAPAATPAATSGDDLAREAAQELEKLRLKK